MFSGVVALSKVGTSLGRCYKRAFGVLVSFIPLSLYWSNPYSFPPWCDALPHIRSCAATQPWPESSGTVNQNPVIIRNEQKFRQPWIITICICKPNKMETHGHLCPKLMTWSLSKEPDDYIKCDQLLQTPLAVFPHTDENSMNSIIWILVFQPQHSSSP